MLIISWVKTQHQLQMQSIKQHSVTNTIVSKFKHNWFFIYSYCRTYQLHDSPPDSWSKLQTWVFDLSIENSHHKTAAAEYCIHFCNVHIEILPRRCHINCLRLDDSCLEPLQSQFHQVSVATRKIRAFLSASEHLMKTSDTDLVNLNRVFPLKHRSAIFAPLWRVGPSQVTEKAHVTNSEMCFSLALAAQWCCRHFVQRIKWICVFGLVTSWVHLLK